MIAAKKSLVGVMPKKESITGKVGVGIKTIYPSLIDLEVTPTKEIQTFKHEDSYGYDNVIIDPIPDEYIIPDGTLEVAQNGDVDVTNFKMARVGVYTPPNLQDKAIEINENGTHLIKADEEYDGLSQVEITVDAIEDLTNEITTYNNELTEQEEQLTTVIQALKNKAGGKIPEVGFVVNEWDSKGYAIKITTYGYKSVPDYGFAGSSSQPSVISKNLTEISFNEELVSIGYGSFISCTNLTTIHLPKNLKTIGNYAFDSCTKLSLDDLPETLTSIGQNAFNKCTNLKIKKIPDGVTQIQQTTFASCTNLSQISMKNVQNTIGTGAYAPFYNCTSLKAVWIGSAMISTFNKNTFVNCKNIIKMFIDLPRATVETFTNYQYAFSNSAVTTDVIICNDDEGFMTKEEFDAIDWATYSV